MRATRCSRLTQLFLLSASMAAAGVPAAGVPGPVVIAQWQPTPLFGGNVQSLAQAPSAPQVFYAGTDVAGVFRSDDGGQTWSARNQTLTGDELYIGGIDVLADGLVVAPKDPNLVYALASGGLLRTRDGGKSWKQLDAAPVLNQLSFRRTGSLLGAAGDGLYESRDEGDSWTLLAFAGLCVTSAVEDLSGEHTLFATLDPGDGLTRDSLWKSTDGGASWQVKFRAFDLFEQLNLDPSRHGSLYLLGNLDLYKSVDDGETWTFSVGAEVVSPLAIAVSADGILYAADYILGVRHSFDGGETWLPAGSTVPFDEILALAVDAAHPGTVLAGGASGIWRSLDRGSAWSSVNVGIMASFPTSLALDPMGTLFAVDEIGVWRSENTGSTWQPLYGPGGRIVADPVRPGILYAPDWFWVSHDAGRTWQAMDLPQAICGGQGWSCTVLGFAIDPRSPDILYVSGYLAYNGPGGNPDTSPVFFRSNDGGTTWRWRDVGTGILFWLDTIAVAPSDPALVYAIEDGGGFVRSEDRGQSWSLAGEGLPVSSEDNYPDPPLSSLAVDPRLSSLVYAGNASGVYRSTDGGRHFAAMGTGLEGADVTTIVVDPTDPSRVYAGVVALGVFRWNEETNHWDALSEAFPPPDAYSYGGQFLGPIALDPGSQILYAATPRGVYRLRLTKP